MRREFCAAWRVLASPPRHVCTALCRCGSCPRAWCVSSPHRSRAARDRRAHLEVCKSASALTQRWPAHPCMSPLPVAAAPPRLSRCGRRTPRQPSPARRSVREGRVRDLNKVLQDWQRRRRLLSRCRRCRRLAGGRHLTGVVEVPIPRRSVTHARS